jgi:hypothetical protein
MSALEFSPSLTALRCTTVRLGDRVIGHIIDAGYDYFIADIRPVDGQAVPIVVDDYAAAVALFEALVNLPADAECFCGDVRAGVVSMSGHVDQTSPEGTAISVHYGSFEPGYHGPEMAFAFRVGADELHAIVKLAGFMVARLAVIS